MLLTRRCMLALCMVVVVALLSLCMTPLASAQQSEIKLTAADAAADDFFGVSVAISGNTAIVGAFLNDDAGDNSGSVYLFDVTTGNQLAKLTAADAAEGDRFGISVAISGNTAIVGAEFDSDGEVHERGSAYLFDVTTGTQLFKLTAADAEVFDQFGNSVAISGNRAIVGAVANDDGGDISGSSYLFDVTTGNQLFKLTAADAVEEGHFGASVAISGNTAIIGADGNGDAGFSSGSAYLFDVSTGTQLFKLTAADAAEGDWFGFSVAISGNTAVVGAFLNDDAGDNSGSVYLFDVTTGNQFAKLTAADAAAGDQFGRSVAISGNTVIVGAAGNDDAGDLSGSAYLFDLTTGNQLAKLTTADAAEQDLFGGSVAISGNTAIVGAYLNDDAGTDSGSAYLFTPVPEPSTACLTILGMLSMISPRRLTRRRMR